MLGWQKLVQALDRVTQKQWSSPIRVLPWREADGTPDFSRPAFETTGVMSFLTDVLVSLGGSSASMTTQLAAMDITCFIQSKKLPYKLRQSDRIHMLDIHQMFSIDRISDEITDDGITVHLLHLPEPPK